MKKLRGDISDVRSLLRLLFRLTVLAVILAVMTPMILTRAAAKESDDLLIYVKRVNRKGSGVFEVQARVEAGTVHVGDTVRICTYDSEGESYTAWTTTIQGILLNNVGADVTESSAGMPAVKSAGAGDRIFLVYTHDEDPDRFKLGAALVSDTASPYQNNRKDLVGTYRKMSTMALTEKQEVFLFRDDDASPKIRSEVIDIPGGNAVESDTPVERVVIGNFDTAQVYRVGDTYAVTIMIDNEPFDPIWYTIGLFTVTGVVSLPDAASAPGYRIAFDSDGEYQWLPAEEGDRYFVKSNNEWEDGTTSELSASVNLSEGKRLSFDYVAYGETYKGKPVDKCIFLIDGEEKFVYGDEGPDWKTYSTLVSEGAHTLTWKYVKDSADSTQGDFFAVDNVKLEELPNVQLFSYCYGSDDYMISHPMFTTFMTGDPDEYVMFPEADPHPDADTIYAAAEKDGRVYATRIGCTLYSVSCSDLSDVTTDRKISTYDNPILTMAYDPKTDAIYGILRRTEGNGESHRELIRIDTEENKIHSLGTLDEKKICGMTFDDNGTGYLIEAESGDFYTFDPETLEVNPVGRVKRSPQNIIQDLCYDPSSGLILWSFAEQDESSPEKMRAGLCWIDPNTLDLADILCTERSERDIYIPLFAGLCIFDGLESNAASETIMVGDTIDLRERFTTDLGMVSDTGYLTADSKVAALNKTTLSAKAAGHTTVTASLFGKQVSLDLMVEFKDVRSGSDHGKNPYYYDAVYWAADKGITGGVKNKKTGLFETFDPSGICSRAQMVSFLWRLEGCPEPKKYTDFSDVKTTDYFYKAVSWAQEKGITGGYKDGTFRPYNDCNRNQAVTFLYRMAGSPEVDLSAAPAFTDIDPKDGHYYNAAVLWAAEQGITGGYKDGTFKPYNHCSRGQMVSFLYRYRQI